MKKIIIVLDKNPTIKILKLYDLLYSLGYKAEILVDKPLFKDLTKKV